MSLSDVSQRAPIERFDVLTVSRRDGSRQLWAECIEKHRADAYAADLERLLDQAPPAAGDVEVVVELTTAILVRPDPPAADPTWTWPCNSVLLDEPEDEGPTDA